MEFNNLATADPRTCISGKVMRLNRITANIFRKYLSPFNITDSQLTVLFILSKMGGKKQKELSDIMVMEKSTLNRNLQRLVERGLLTKDEFPLIQATQAGKKLANEMVPEWQKAMNEIQNLLGNEGEQALDLVLHQLQNN